MKEHILEMSGITKYIFDENGKGLVSSGVKILDSVDFNLYKGEVHILVGENGAGKSTLMKVLGGIIPADEGEIFFEKEKLTAKNPMEARKMGISFVHQELNICPNLSIADNIYLGIEPKKRGFLDKKAMYKKAEELLKSLDFDLEPGRLAGTLSTAEQQVVEIVTALSFQSKILIMDEPTASLSQKEIEHLFRIVKQLKSQGIGIIYISHRFDEFKEIGDRISVLRDGKMIGTLPIEEFAPHKVVSMMVGRETDSEMYVNTHHIQQDIILEVDGVKLSEQTSPCNIKIRKGEVVGLAGLVGAGRTELAKCIYGARKSFGGRVVYKGEEYSRRTPADSIKKGIVYLTEDRKVEGLVLDFSIKENIDLSTLDVLFKNKFLKKRTERKIAEKYIKDNNIVCRSPEQIVRTLSGGNQQKVVLSKCLEIKPSLLILDEPTRGIDVNAKAEIYSKIDAIAAEGIAVLMISSEMPELIGMSDRIYVMSRGTITGEVERKEEMTQERIMQHSLS